MALTIDECCPVTPIGLADYIEHVAKAVDVCDDASVVESADLLRSLASNRSVVAEKFNADLRAAIVGRGLESVADYVSTSYVLGRGPGFVVRANLWLPPTGFGKQQASMHEVNSYGRPHDHDFSFLTVGYWGSGYSTSIYEYDSEAISGVIGEQIEMRFLENTTLPVGKVMYYRASRDIHTQEYPVQPSVSLNLLQIPRQPRPQYSFDVEESRLIGLVNNGAEDAIGLCRLARFVGNEQTVDYLHQIAGAHPTPRARWAAYESLRIMQPDEELVLLCRALGDPADLVATAARRTLVARG